MKTKVFPLSIHQRPGKQQLLRVGEMLPQGLTEAGFFKLTVPSDALC